MNKNLVNLMKFIGESVDDIDFDKELGDYYGTGDTLDRFRAIFNQLNLGEYTDENIQKAIDHGNFSDNEKNFIWDTFAADDTEELFESSIKKLCNVAGKPALAEAVNSNKEKTSITAVGKLELYAGDFSTQFFAEVYSKDGWTEELAIDLAAEIEKQFKPGEIETEYLSPMDNMNDNRGGCTYQIVMNMNISISLSALDSRVQGAMYKFQSVPTIKYNDEGESDANVQTNNDIERQVADNIDTAMMDHYDMMNGDIGDLFESSIKKLCNVAGKPALAEAVMKLYKVYHPVMEASDTVYQLFSDYCDKEGITRLEPENISKIINTMIVDHRITYEEGEELYNEFKTKLAKHGLLESAHKVPEEMARAVNDYVADTFYRNPDTREQLRASELESNWEWLDEDASELIPVWDETHSGEAVWNAKCNIEERGVGAAEASMM